MTDTDKIRMKFEDFGREKSWNLKKDCIGIYEYIEVQYAWCAYQAAYQQGQRDLIEAMNGRTLHSKLIEEGKPIFIFPEETPK